MEYINLKQRKDILKLGFKDEEGNVILDNNGNEIFLEFECGDVELPLRYNRCVNLINQARNSLKNKFIIIDKKQDKKGKQFLSSNEEEKVKALKQFYKDMEIAMDLFLGEGGTRKFLNGRNPYWEMWDDISETLKPYNDRLKLTVTNMADRIKEKYGTNESDVLTND